MPPRLAHKKSRRGCHRCKIRKVKCDELHPTCTACQRHRVKCIWPDDQSPAKTSSPHRSLEVVTNNNHTHASPVAAHAIASPYDTDVAEGFDPDDSRLIDLHLLHYYLTIDSQQLPIWHETPEMAQIWNIHCVNFGLRHTFLLHAILAIAALHGALVRPDPNRASAQALFRLKGTKHDSSTSGLKPFDQGEYAKAHRYYLNLASRGLREEIGHINGSNAEPIALTSILLSIVSQNLLPATEAAYEPPVQWFSLAQSLVPVFTTARVLVPDTSIVEAIVSLADIVPSRPPSNI